MKTPLMFLVWKLHEGSAQAQTESANRREKNKKNMLTHTSLSLIQYEMFLKNFLLKEYMSIKEHQRKTLLHEHETSFPLLLNITHTS